MRSQMLERTATLPGLLLARERRCRIRSNGTLRAATDLRSVQTIRLSENHQHSVPHTWRESPYSFAASLEGNELEALFDSHLRQCGTREMLDVAAIPKDRQRFVHSVRYGKCDVPEVSPIRGCDGQEASGPQGILGAREENTGGI